MRTFDTGAIRDDVDDKPDYEGFYSASVMYCFGQYMQKHRKQADGSLRDSDNWQKGMPLNVYIKSAWRHFFVWWKLHREDQVNSPFVIEALCGLMFNVQGYLHEYLKKQYTKDNTSLVDAELMLDAIKKARAVEEAALDAKEVALDAKEVALDAVEDACEPDKYQEDFDIRDGDYDTKFRGRTKPRNPELAEQQTASFERSKAAHAVVPKPLTAAEDITNERHRLPAHTQPLTDQDEPDDPAFGKNL